MAECYTFFIWDKRLNERWTSPTLTEILLRYSSLYEVHSVAGLLGVKAVSRMEYIKSAPNRIRRGVVGPQYGWHMLVCQNYIRWAIWHCV